MNKIFIVSDGTGRTGEQVLKAAMTQFPNSTVEIIMKQEIRTEEQVEEIILEAAAEKAFVVHTVVSESQREAINRITRIHNVPSMDLMGPLLLRLSNHLSNAPTGEPGLFFTLNQEYFKRIDSMQFAFNHDDGQRYYDYDKAEIILVGVSRTFKTPLSIYLAFKGWFVANYPVVLGVDPPDILSKMHLGRVFGLTTDPSALMGLRTVRQQYLGGNSGDYASLDHVRKELNYSEMIFARNQWPVVNVTNKPIEEIASEILAIRRRFDENK
jgi:regulator of PEP synthase PpsR (kinase-PPPase family)